MENWGSYRWAVVAALILGALWAYGHFAGSTASEPSSTDRPEQVDITGLLGALRQADSEFWQELCLDVESGRLKDSALAPLLEGFAAAKPAGDAPVAAGDDKRPVATAVIAHMTDTVASECRKHPK
jgi:hypothetical protein